MAKSSFKSTIKFDLRKAFTKLHQPSPVPSWWSHNCSLTLALEIKSYISSSINTWPSAVILCFRGHPSPKTIEDIVQYIFWNNVSVVLQVMILLAFLAEPGTQPGTRYIKHTVHKMKNSTYLVNKTSHKNIEAKKLLWRKLYENWNKFNKINIKQVIQSALCTL